MRFLVVTEKNAMVAVFTPFMFHCVCNVLTLPQSGSNYLLTAFVFRKARFFAIKSKSTKNVTVYDYLNEIKNV